MTQWDTVTVVGAGLIGGSVGLALQRRGLVRQVIGVGRRESSLRRAKQLGVVTATTTSLELGVKEAEFVVVATPVETVVDRIRAVADHCLADAVVTDAASTKQSIVESIGDSGLGDLFVGSHPMAGSEKTGPEAADPDLFKGRLVVVTPTGETAVQRTEIVERVWESLGARTLQMDPSVHDEAVANASHLPHVLASALAATANERALSVVGTGWLDTTRIAAGDAELWRQILMDNRSRIIAEIDKLSGVLTGFRQALADSNDAELIRLLQQGKERRDAVGN